MRSYRIVESFLTVQGEGFYTGVASVFVRFAGCNLWSGRDEHRERDAARTGALCPRWCDTDFREGEAMSAEEVGARVHALAGEVRHVVLTGGEPLLYIDAPLLSAIRKAHPIAHIAVETNGTVHPREGVGLACTRHGIYAEQCIDWVCCSPKVQSQHLALAIVDELKVVVPDYDPLSFDGIEATHRFVQPRAQTTSVGCSTVDRETMGRAAAFVMQNPSWRLSVQTHKIVGVP